MMLASAAAALTVPSPAASLRHYDYPHWALEKEASAASIIHVVVEPGGGVAQCANVHEFGDRRLAKEVCGIIIRKRMESPTLRNGRKVYAFVDAMVVFFLPGTKEGRKIMALRRTPDAELSVNKLPKGTSARVQILLAYDEDGKVADCAPSEKDDVILARIACDQKTLFDNMIRKDPTGQPVSYVTRKIVGFTVLPPAK